MCSRKYRWIKIIFGFNSILIFAVLIRVFLFEVFFIPSESMEDTLLSGDVVLVSKLNYGPALPRSPLEIPLVNVFFI